MSESERATTAPDAADDPIVGSGSADDAGRTELDWWHRDHPTFTALSGFFGGVVAAAVVPALYIGLLHVAVDDDTAEEAFPFILLVFAVPICLIVFSRTRRFGSYLLFGMVITLLVVFGVGSLVFWLMLRTST